MPRFRIVYRIYVGRGSEYDIDASDGDAAIEKFDDICNNSPSTLFDADAMAKEVKSGSAFIEVEFDWIKELDKE